MFQRALTARGATTIARAPSADALATKRLASALGRKAYITSRWCELQCGQSETAQSGTAKASSASAVGSAYRATRKKRGMSALSMEAKASTEMVPFVPEKGRRGRICRVCRENQRQPGLQFSASRVCSWIFYLCGATIGRPGPDCSASGLHVLHKLRFYGSHSQLDPVSNFNLVLKEATDQDLSESILAALTSARITFLH